MSEELVPVRKVASSEYLREAAQAAIAALPEARGQTLKGEFHEVSPETLASVLSEFFAT